jgi:hypothetical protein
MSANADTPDGSDPQVTVRIARGREPIEGGLTDHTGETRPFHGWLELTAALEAARNDGNRDEQRRNP